MTRTAKQVILRAPTKYGFFGLNELYSFFNKQLSFSFESKTDVDLVMDFSDVIYWDISALLWMVVALHHFQKRSETEKKNVQFMFRFPQPEREDIPFENMSGKDFGYFKGADYLRRWKFKDALKNLVDNPDDMVVDEQKGYILSDARFYSPRMVSGLRNLEEQLLSQGLAEIRNLVELSQPPQYRKVTRERVDICVDRFWERAFATIITNQCDIETDVGQMFISNLLYEALANALQHPKANIGMFALSRIGHNKLVLVVADNGESICKTIYGHFRHEQVDVAKGLPLKYDRGHLDASIRRDLVVHATREGVSRKLIDADVDWEEPQVAKRHGIATKIGQGLTNILKTTVNDFHGNLIIATDGISVKFASTPEKGDESNSFDDIDFAWPGNLIRIQITLKEKSPASC